MNTQGIDKNCKLRIALALDELLGLDFRKIKSQLPNRNIIHWISDTSQLLSSFAQISSFAQLSSFAKTSRRERLQLHRYD